MVVTLLDLRNAFGTVDHRLIQKVLEYHHIPENINCIIKSYYENYKIRIGTAAYVTEPIAVKNDVLQGDCRSPLLFNMVVNTLIKCIDDERIKCLGYNYCYTTLVLNIGSNLRMTLHSSRIRWRALNRY